MDSIATIPNQTTDYAYVASCEDEYSSNWSLAYWLPGSSLILALPTDAPKCADDLDVIFCFDEESGTPIARPTFVADDPDLLAPADLFIPFAPDYSTVGRSAKVARQFDLEWDF